MTSYILRTPGGSSEAKQDEILAQMALSLAELQQKLEEGQEVALDSDTLAALETVNAVVSGTVTVAGSSTEAKQDVIISALATLLIELQQKLEPGQQVALDGATLAALESINAVVSGIVALDGSTLAALESITTTIANWPSDFPDTAVLAKVEAVRALLEAGLEVSGSIEVENFPAEFPLPAGQITALTPQTDSLTNDQLRAAEVPVSDDYSTESHAAQQVGADGVLTFTIAAGQLVGVAVLPADSSDTEFYYACATCDGSAPSATSGFVCAVGGMTYLPAPTSGTVKVYAPTGTLIQVSGWAR